MGKGASLKACPYQFYVDFHLEEHGYSEIFPPFLVNAASLQHRAITENGRLYTCEKDELYLIPTAEVPITNFYRDEMLPRCLDNKIMRLFCMFRREAGSYGKDTRALSA